MWQTVPERRIGSSERSVTNSPTISAGHVELQSCANAFSSIYVLPLHASTLLIQNIRGAP